MRALLTILALMLIAFTSHFSYGQTQPNLPAGSTSYSGNLFMDPDGNVWTGRTGNYTNLGTWEKVQALFNPEATVQFFAADPSFNFSSPSYNTFAITSVMRQKYGDNPRVLLQVRKAGDPSGEWTDSMEGFTRIRGPNNETTGVRFQTSGFAAILIITR